MAAPRVPSRAEAIGILEADRARTAELLEGVLRRDLTRPGLGGGSWSPKDLFGHLASWEEHALDALAAWDGGERAPIDMLLRSVGIVRVNDQEVARKASWSLARVRRDSERVHAELLDAIRSVGDARWRAPTGARARRPLALRLGGILGGPDGPFTHDRAHHPSLEHFVEPRTSRGRRS